MHLNHALIVTALAAAPTALGLMTATPAVASPDVGQWVCSQIAQQGAQLRTFLTINVSLQQQGIRNADSVVHQSVTNNCPQYGAALAQADREAGRIAGGIPNDGPGSGQCPRGTYYMPNQGICVR